MPSKRRIEWSEQARLDLMDVVEHVAADRPSAARRLVREIDKRLAQVARFPYSGRPIPEDQAPAGERDRREVIVMRWRVGYLAGPGSSITVLYVLDGARMFPPLR